MLDDIIVECPVCGHPIDSNVDEFGKHIRCPECDNLWILSRDDMIPSDAWEEADAEARMIE